VAVDPIFLNEIQTVLGSAISPAYNTKSKAYDVFEGYVFTIVIKAAQAEGAIVTYKDVHGQTPTAFVFRTSPGSIQSNLHSYTHAVIEFPGTGKPVQEAHIGVYVRGTQKLDTNAMSS